MANVQMDSVRLASGERVVVTLNVLEAWGGEVLRKVPTSMVKESGEQLTADERAEVQRRYDA